MTTDSQPHRPTPSQAPVKQLREPRPTNILAGLVLFAKLAVAVVALAAAFWLGSEFGAAPSESPAGKVARDVNEAGAHIDYWTCSMHPQIRQTKPGYCPICGMKLVPVKNVGETPEAKKVKYACAMMCVPPTDRPGRCPVCGMDMVPAEEHGGGQTAEGAKAANVLGEITLSEAARRLAQLQLAPVTRRFVDHEIRMVGKVDYDETRQRTISSRVPGRLDRLYVDYTGVPVRKGEHLVSLYSPELLSAQEELIQALQAFTELQPAAPEDVRRLRAETLQAARQKLALWGLTEEQIAETEQRRAPSDHLTIYAPIGGIVTEKRVVEGAYVETGTEIYTISDLTYLWVKLDAYEVDLAWLRYGQDVEFTTEAYPGETFHGTVAFIDPVLNARTRTAKVRVNVSNLEGRLKPEMFVRAFVRSQRTADGRVMYPALAGKWICPMHPEVTSDRKGPCSQCGMPLESAESLGYAAPASSEVRPPLVIPAAAPLLTGTRAVVYVAREDRPGRYEGREVVLGPRAGDFYLVRDGLTEGELVVVNGTLYLDSAVQILGRRSMMHAETADPAAGYPGSRR